jgi:UTP--glucose-1-phosphate uridylyltransferase
VITKVIIPVAGLGTRLLPISKSIPKELVPVVDRPLIQHVVEEALAAGLNEIILVTRGGKSAIEDHFDHHYELESELEKKGKADLLAELRAIVPPELKVTSVRQDKALGLGHAVACAAHLISDNEAFAVLLPDVLVKPQLTQRGDNDLAQMVRIFQQSQAAQIMVEQVPLEQVDRYGIADCAGQPLKAGHSITMQGVVEKPSQEEAPSQLAVVGRYILPGKIMSLLARTTPGAGGEIQLTDAIDQLIQQGQVEAFCMSGRSFDCGHIAGWLAANQTLAIEAGLLEPVSQELCPPVSGS